MVKYVPSHRPTLENIKNSEWMKEGIASENEVKAELERRKGILNKTSNDVNITSNVTLNEHPNVNVNNSCNTKINFIHKSEEVLVDPIININIGYDVIDLKQKEK